MSRSLILRGCTAVDARGARDGLVDIVVRDGRIASIGASDGGGPPEARGLDELDGSGATVVPGLVNMHEHLSFAHPGSNEEIAGEDLDARLARMADNARRGLGAGVTSMRLVGEADGHEHAVRDEIVAGRAAGPRIWTAGSPLTYQGGHGGAVGAIAADSPDAYRRMAGEQLERGADLLKIMISGGGAGGAVEVVRMRHEDFAAIRDVAREAGVKIAVHTAAVRDPIVEALIADGVDSLEHCYIQPADVLRECVDQSVLQVMTPLVSRSPDYFRAIELPQQLIEGSVATGTTHQPAVRAAVAAGAPLALGTDFHSHLRIGGTWAVVHELEVYEEAGVDPLGLLALASRNGAEWLGRADDIGLVEEGFVADLLLLERNPLDVGAAAFRELRTVVADGRTHEPIEAATPGETL